MHKDIHNHKHLTLEDRKIIQDMLNNKSKLSEIAKAISKDDRTIAKEIQNNRSFKDQSSRRKFIWGSTSDRQKPCDRLVRFPRVCNGCSNNCVRDHYKYYADEAQHKYERTLSLSRQGVDLTPHKQALIDKVVKEGVKQGHSLYAIKMNNPEIITCSVKTLYNYVENDVLSTKNIDLRSKVKYKPRKKKYAYNKSADDKTCLTGRKIDDYFKFILDNPGINTVQLDTVEGSQSSTKCFMTLHFINYHFMMIFTLNSKTISEVAKAFNWIQQQIGIDDFRKLFPCILTDRGTEFLDPAGIEFDNETGELRTKVFYCDSYVSNQKAQIESNHRKIRYIVPKGTYMDNYNSNHSQIIMNNIASYPIRELSGNTPYEMMELVYGKELLNKLGIKKIDRTRVNLTPSLLAQ